ncbi:MAG: DUF4406 domain-containing protein [Candidatus Paceibacterota bacterium]|jgi:hypothetical protein
MKIIYVASPYAGGIQKNTEFAKRACRHVMEQGHAFFAPHLLYPSLLCESVSAERELGLDMGLAILPRCDELWCYGDHISHGMMAEVAKATTPLVDNRLTTQQHKILNHLKDYCIGKSRAISMERLAILFGISDRKVREEIETIRRFRPNHVIIASDNNGYYIPLESEKDEANAMLLQRLKVHRLTHHRHSFTIVLRDYRIC